jgi:hypothetical protein
MKLTKISAFGFVLAFLIPTAVIAQTFGEYGRTLGGVTQQGGIARVLREDCRRVAEGQQKESAISVDVACHLG